MAFLFGRFVPPSPGEATLAHRDGRAADARLAGRIEGPVPQARVPDYYGLLGVAPTASQAEIARAYGRRARAAAGRPLGGRRAAAELALLNAAYEVLGNPERRADYDRQRLAQSYWELFERAPAGQDGLPSDWERDDLPPGLRRQPRRVSQPTGGALDVVAIVLVIGLASLVAVLVGGRLAQLNLDAIPALVGSLGLGSTQRPVVGYVPPPATATPVPTPAPVATPTPAPAPAARYAGSSASVQNPTPAVHTDQVVTLVLRREGRPVIGVPVYLIAHYRTVDERWPAGSSVVQTDANGVATIRFNVGNATRGYVVKVDVVATIDGQPLTFQTQFTPR